MKPNPQLPGERELNLLTGSVVLFLGLMILVLWHVQGGIPLAFPALLGWCFITCGGLIVLTSLRRRRIRRESRSLHPASPSRN